MAANNNQIPVLGDDVKKPLAKEAMGFNLERPNFEEDLTQKTSRKVRENPMVPIGMAGFFGAVAYGIRHFKNRPKTMTASMYVMQFRVFAQTIAVGCMGVGIGYTVLKEKYFKSDSSIDIKK